MSADPETLALTVSSSDDGFSEDAFDLDAFDAGAFGQSEIGEVIPVSVSRDTTIFITGANGTMATPNDITWYKGEAIVLLCTVSPVVDITGWTIELTVKKYQTDTVFLIQKSPATLVAPAGGQFSFSLTSAETKTLGAGFFFYDIQRIDAGSEAVLSIGPLVVNQEVLYP